jgi:hypothetical protein
MRSKLLERIAKREWAKRQQSLVEEYEIESIVIAADVAASSTPESPRVVCAVHGWAPVLRPGAPLPPAQLCPECQQAAPRAAGQFVPILSSALHTGVPVAEDPRLDELYRKWQEEHPERIGTGPQPGGYEEREALDRITEARWEREAGIDRGGQVVYRSPYDPSRVHYAPPRKPKKVARPVMTEAAIEAVSDGFW